MAERVCLSDEQLMPLVGGDRAPADVAGHLDDCPSCRNRLEHLRREVSTLRDTFKAITETHVLPAEDRHSCLSAEDRHSSLPEKDRHSCLSEKHSHSSLPEAPEIPATIGRYRVIGVLDSGGQACVYRVAHPNLPRELVVKLGHPTARREASGGRQERQPASDRQERQPSSDRQERQPSSDRPIFDTAFPYPIDGEAVASTGDGFGTTRTLPCGG